MRLLTCTTAMAVATLYFAQIAPAQNYPVKSVHVIVGVVAGGGTDSQARLLSRKFQESMGQSFIVDNRPGASGTIGTEIVVKSPPDGYTILCASSSLVTNSLLYKRLTFDPAKDLAPVGHVSSAPLFLIAHPSLPVRSPQDLVALAKKNAGTLNAGSSGNGSANHLSIEMLKQMAGISVTHIPYKGGAMSMNALIGGEVDFTFTGAITALPHIKSGRVRGLAVSSVKRSSSAPELPTLQSLYPDFQAENWYALFVPAGTPAEIITKINSEIVKAIKSPDLRDFMISEGAEPVGGTPQEAALYFRREMARWAKVIAAGKVTVE